MAKVKPDDLASEVIKCLADYSEDVVEAIEKSSRRILKEGRKDVTVKSPRRTGTYAKGWTTELKASRGRLEGRIYNKDRPGLTHLLEHGHVTKNGTGRAFPRTPAHPHILEVNDAVQAKLEEAIKEAIGNG